LNDAWWGQTCIVDCACERSYVTASGSPDRPVVGGSNRTEGLYTFYRPQLTMMVTGIRNSFAEYRADYQWQIDLRELQAP